MDVIIEPGALQGTLTAPPSKSYSQRALAAALLCEKPSLLSGVGNSKDELAALAIIKALGAEVHSGPEGYKILPPPAGTRAKALRIFCGESGLSSRMFTPIVALLAETTEVIGSGSLLNRPMEFFETVLPQLGLQVKSEGGKLPLQITGDFWPASIVIDGSASSQYLTGLLFAFSAAVARKGFARAAETSIAVRNLNSRPYVQLTLDVLKAFDMPVPVWDAEDRFTFALPSVGESDGSGRHSPGSDQPSRKPDPRNDASDPGSSASNPSPDTIRYTVPGDWSGAAFLVVAAALFGDIALHGLDADSPQGDKAILQALLDCGVGVSWKGEELFISGAAQRRAFQFDATHCPDLFPPLMVLASFCAGVSELKGASRLIHKESNRADTLSSEFRKLGVQVEVAGDVIRVTGGTVQGGEVSAHGDHRIAMACALAGLGATAPVRIAGAEAIEKSYPGFFEDLQALGGQLQYIGKA